MSTKLAFRDGGKTSEEGISRLLSKMFTEDGVVGDNDLLVEAQGTPDNTVKVNLGDIIIGKTSPVAGLPDYFYHAWVTVAENVTITANSSGNPRIDAIVAYIDLSVVSSASNDNPGVLKFYDVNGTPAATPVTPTDAAIQSAVGASNPWVLLAHVAVANGFSTITNSNITDTRPKTDTPSRVMDNVGVDYIINGLVPSQTSGLNGQISTGVAYVDGQRVTKPLVLKLFTASKDTYVDIPKTAKPTTNNDYTFTEVANNAAEPSLASGSLRIAKVITNGSNITSVVTYGTGWKLYTPVWSSTGTAVSLGNGTIYGHYIQVGKKVTVSITFTYGSTSTPGTGTWLFSLPVNAKVAIADIGTGIITDADANAYILFASIITDATNLSGGSTGFATLGAGSPITWAVGDAVRLTLVYEAA